MGSEMCIRDSFYVNLSVSLIIHLIDRAMKRSVRISRRSTCLSSMGLEEPPPGAAYEGATLQSLKESSTYTNGLYKPSVFNPATLTDKGLVRVAQDRVSELESQDRKCGFNMYYEIHGKGPCRLLFLMGLNNSSSRFVGMHN